MTSVLRSISYELLKVCNENHIRSLRSAIKSQFSKNKTIFVFFHFITWKFAYVKYFLAWQLSLILFLLCHLLNVRLKILVFPRNFHLRTKVSLCHFDTIVYVFLVFQTNENLFRCFGIECLCECTKKKQIYSVSH